MWLFNFLENDNVFLTEQRPSLAQCAIKPLGELRDRIGKVLSFVPLTSKIARREILILRVGTELIHYTQAELRIEYTPKVSNQLQGSLDYLLKTNLGDRLLIVEAKYEDSAKGFLNLLPN